MEGGALVIFYFCFCFYKENIYAFGCYTEVLFRAPKLRAIAPPLVKWIVLLVIICLLGKRLAKKETASYVIIFKCIKDVK
jgi:hypothetical protein